LALKLPNLHILEIVDEAIKIITSRQQLRRFLATPLYTNAVYLMADAVITGLLSFLFWIVVARFYAEAEVGYSSAILSVIIFLALLSLLGFDASLIRFLPQAEKPQDLINSCFTLASLTSLVIAGIFLAGLHIWSPALVFIRGNAVFVAAFVTFTLLIPLSFLMNAVFIAKRRAGFILSKNIIFSLLRIPMPVLFVLFFHTFGIVASWGIALGIAVAVSLFLFLPRVQNLYKPIPILKLSLFKGMWQYSGGNYLTTLFALAPTSVLPMMVVNLLGPVQNAYFYIALMSTTFLTAIPIGVCLSLFAEGSHFEDKLWENVRKSVKFTFLLLVPAVILFILVGRWLLLAFGQSYPANALHLLWILTISSLPLSINHLYTTILRVTARIKELVIIWAFIAIAVLGISYLVMPGTGIIGIGYVWLGIQCLVAIYALIFTRRLRQDLN
jgi:O-antigen/teichoic acid export membrane protein